MSIMSADGGSLVESAHHVHRRISWGALFGGVILVVAIELLLALLGAGIGLGTVNVNAGSTPDASSFGIGAGLWWVVSSCIALFAGGYAAAWLAGIEVRFDGILHGLVTWGIATIVTVYLLTSAIGGNHRRRLLGDRQRDVGSRRQPQAGGRSDRQRNRHLARHGPAAGQGLPAADQPRSVEHEPAGRQKAVAQNLVTYARGGPDAPGGQRRRSSTSRLRRRR